MGEEGDSMFKVGDIVVNKQNGFSGKILAVTCCEEQDLVTYSVVRLDDPDEYPRVHIWPAEVIDK